MSGFESTLAELFAPPDLEIVSARLAMARIFRLTARLTAVNASPRAKLNDLPPQSAFELLGVGHGCHFSNCPKACQVIFCYD